MYYTLGCVGTEIAQVFDQISGRFLYTSRFQMFICEQLKKMAIEIQNDLA